MFMVDFYIEFDLKKYGVQDFSKVDFIIVKGEQVVWVMFFELQALKMWLDMLGVYQFV